MPQQNPRPQSEPAHDADRVVLSGARALSSDSGRAAGRGQARQQRALLAAAHLSAADPRMAALIARIGPHRPIRTADPFDSLVQAIISQQVSMKAAAAIAKRVRALCPSGRFTAKELRARRLPTLRRAGLSRQKAIYIHDLADHFASGRLSASKLRRMSDDEVIAATTAVKGIGRWTAEMLLIFCLERPDVWPVDDLGLRKAVQRFLNLAETPAAREIRDVAAPWRPYRSYATWYLWRSLEGPMMPGVAIR